MAAGSLRDRCVFEREGAGADDYNNAGSGEWPPLATVWGMFRPERATERMEAGRLEDPVAGRLKVRSSPATRQVTASDRVTINQVPYAIRGITNPDGHNRWLEITVERGVEA